MPRARRYTARQAASVRGGSRDRHGRGIRGPVTGPHLPLLQTRTDFFEMTVGSAIDYLRGAWPDELAGIRVDVAATPDVDPARLRATGIARWRVDHAERRITLYRVPIQRLAKLHRRDEFHERMLIESHVFRAVAELLGRDPWDISPDRFRHL
ncbi:metallopeptidase family protein [Rathayibacter sp. SD072]|uniref:metallopeptidase family protein n=1 Tax=Rathayibacter sp. SD072 TaxID=2781731 RepID=UPI001A975A53|nr:metallopeptidase family protein [Rathayibacter sp. SD072]MBO0984866.1 metallopeptidase family protein [Rathayibacter sp. SD072]